MDDLRKTYNKIAEDWNKDHCNDPMFVGVKKFIKLMGKGKNVLDLGCGSGIRSKTLADAGLKVMGIDLSEKMIEIAKKTVPNGKFLVMDIHDIKIKKKFDGLFAQASLLHVKKNKAKEVIKSWVKLLKPLGYLFIAVKEKENKDEAIIKEKDYGYEYQRFFSFYTKQEIENYIGDAGLEVVYSIVGQRAGKTNWVQVIGRKND